MNKDVIVVGENDSGYGDEDDMFDAAEAAELKDYRLRMYEAVQKQQAKSKSAVAPAALQSDLDA